MGAGECDHLQRVVVLPQGGIVPVCRGTERTRRQLLALGLKSEPISELGVSSETQTKPPVPRWAHSARGDIFLEDCGVDYCINLYGCVEVSMGEFFSHPWLAVLRKSGPLVVASVGQFCVAIFEKRRQGIFVGGVGTMSCLLSSKFVAFSIGVCWIRALWIPAIICDWISIAAAPP